MLAVGNGRATADRRSLLDLGAEATADDETAAAEAHSPGLRLVDLRSGGIVATLLDDELIEPVMIAPDGSVSAYGPVSHEMPTMGSSAIGFRLARLDPRMLDIEAEREFSTCRRVALVPAEST